MQYILRRYFVLDCDVEGPYELKQELAKLEELLGQFKPAFVVVTGKQRYHIYCDAKGREIHSQKLTDHTHIKGWHGYVVVRDLGILKHRSRIKYAIRMLTTIRED